MRIDANRGYVARSSSELRIAGAVASRRFCGEWSLPAALVTVFVTVCATALLALTVA